MWIGGHANILRKADTNTEMIVRGVRGVQGKQAECSWLNQAVTEIKGKKDTGVSLIVHTLADASQKQCLTFGASRDSRSAFVHI